MFMCVSWLDCLPSVKLNLKSVSVCVCNSWLVHMCNLDLTVFSNRCKFDACVYL